MTSSGALPAGQGPPLVFLTGPTACGKSALAMHMAARAATDGLPPCVIINGDSKQLYRELAILTARPSRADEACFPHLLYGVAGTGTVCSAGWWTQRAGAEVRAAWRAGCLPLVTGGTGMYLRALSRGLADMPDIPDRIRRQLRGDWQMRGLAPLYRELAERAPRVAARLHPHDRQRILRALEVCRAGEAGAPLVAGGTPWPGPVLWLSIEPERTCLHAAIGSRLDGMVQGGVLDEIRQMSRTETEDGTAPDPSHPLFRASGLPAFLRALAGEIPVAAATELAKRDTRRYAKRQMTWLRWQIPAGDGLVRFPDLATACREAPAITERFLAENRLPGRKRGLASPVPFG